MCHFMDQTLFLNVQRDPFVLESPVKTLELVRFLLLIFFNCRFRWTASFEQKGQIQGLLR